MKKIVITYGSFDLFHYGHARLLKRARSLGDRLIVALSTDKFCEKKGKKAVMSFDERAEVLRSIKHVDEVIPEIDWDQKVGDIINRKVNIFVMGSDWEGKFDFLKPMCEVVILPRTETISTTDIKGRLLNNL